MHKYWAIALTCDKFAESSFIMELQLHFASRPNMRM
jgi:hypothetical protein